ncbi:MAG TPA: SMP-30/gluconolactonase/LRE family protein [Verrucomicrobiae bacterium]|nr:SMP-30/gluconolactonase/LRE family protein [Verrucomicrobiae bacterium]
MPALAQSKQKPPTIQAELWHRQKCALAEGPVWADGALYWVDVAGKMIFVKRDGETEAETHLLPVEPGSLALGEGTAAVLATEAGFQSYDFTTRRLEPLVNPEINLRGNRFNDGKCDPHGRFVAGTMNRAGKPEAALYSLSTDRAATELLRGLTCSNGLAWSPDGSIFYHIDTPTNSIRAFDYDLESGRLSNGRIVARIPEPHGRPDGMTIDRDGNLWIALWDGSGIECWNPRTGEQVARIDVPVTRVSSCIFGGQKFATLFITTASIGLDEQARAEQPLAGSIFRAQPGVSGYPAVRFGGS